MIPSSLAAVTGHCIVDGIERPLAECDQLVRNAKGPVLAALLPFIIAGAAYFVGWLIMLLHAAKNPVANKTLWIILLVFVNPSWLVYYFLVKRPFDKALEHARSHTPKSTT